MTSDPVLDEVCKHETLQPNNEACNYTGIFIKKVIHTWIYIVNILFKLFQNLKPFWGYIVTSYITNQNNKQNP